MFPIYGFGAFLGVLGLKKSQKIPENRRNWKKLTEVAKYQQKSQFFLGKN
jgi:hypothetical protein